MIKEDFQHRVDGIVGLLLMIEGLLEQYPGTVANPVAGMIFAHRLVALAFECDV